MPKLIDTMQPDDHLIALHNDLKDFRDSKPKGQNEMINTYRNAMSEVKFQFETAFEGANLQDSEVFTQMIANHQNKLGDPNLNQNDAISRCDGIREELKRAIDGHIKYSAIENKEEAKLFLSSAINMVLQKAENDTLRPEEAKEAGRKAIRVLNDIDEKGVKVDQAEKKFMLDILKDDQFISFPDKVADAVESYEYQATARLAKQASFFQKPPESNKDRDDLLKDIKVSLQDIKKIDKEAYKELNSFVDNKLKNSKDFNEDLKDFKALANAYSDEYQSKINSKTVKSQNLKEDISKITFNPFKSIVKRVQKWIADKSVDRNKHRKAAMQKVATKASPQR